MNNYEYYFGSVDAVCKHTDTSRYCSWVTINEGIIAFDRFEMDRKMDGKDGADLRFKMWLLMKHEEESNESTNRL